MEVSNRSRARALLRTRRHWVQLAKFCVVGAVGYGINVAVYTVLLHAGLHYLLAVPLGRQFEQIMNARYLEHEGFGWAAETLDDPRTVLDFVAAIPACEDKLASYEQDGNKLILEALDGLLDRAEAGLLSR